VAKLNGDYFVSARSATKLSGFEWCPTNILVDYLWAAGEPSDTPVPELVVIFKLDNPPVIARDKILSSVPLSETHNFVCEVCLLSYITYVNYYYYLYDINKVQFFAYKMTVVSENSMLKHRNRNTVSLKASKCIVQSFSFKLTVLYSHFLLN
jgi:hypothetical protein